MAGSRWVLQGKENQQSGIDLSDLLDRVSGFALANLLWVLLSLPIVTMPSAKAGLFAATSPWARGKTGELFRDFFDGMRQCWFKSTVVVVLDLAVGGLVAINLTIFRMMNLSQPLTVMSQSAMLCVALLIVMVNLYIWPLMVLFNMPLNQLFLASLQMVIAYPWRSLLLLLAGLVPLLLGLVLPAAVMIIVSVSASALLINWGAWRVIRLFIAAEDLAKLEVKSSFRFRGQNKRSI